MNDHETANPDRIGVLERALRLACERVADSPQTYEEANSADGWFRVFVAAAGTGKSVREVIEATPPPEPMTDEERAAWLKIHCP